MRPVVATDFLYSWASLKNSKGSGVIENGDVSVISVTTSSESFKVNKHR